MQAQFRLSDLIPSELNVDEVRDAGDAIIVAAYGRSQDCTCPTAEPPPVVFIVATLE